MLNLGNIKIRKKKEVPEYTVFRRKHNENLYNENITHYLQNKREYLNFISRIMYWLLICVEQY